MVEREEGARRQSRAAKHGTHPTFLSTQLQASFSPCPAMDVAPLRPPGTKQPLYKVLLEASLAALAEGGSGTASSQEPGSIRPANNSGLHGPTQTKPGAKYTPGTNSISAHHTQMARAGPSAAALEGTMGLPEKTNTFQDMGPVTALLASPASVADSPELWRLATRAKDALPNGARLENLTWRAMHMSMKKREQDKQRRSNSGHEAAAPSDFANMDIVDLDALDNIGEGALASGSVTVGFSAKSPAGLSSSSKPTSPATSDAAEAMDWSDSTAGSSSVRVRSAARANGNGKDSANTGSTDDMRKQLLADLASHQISAAVTAAMGNILGTPNVSRT